MLAHWVWSVVSGTQIIYLFGTLGKLFDYNDLNVHHGTKQLFLPSIADLTSVYSRLSFAQPLCHWLGNHSVKEVICLLHLIVQHLHALFELAGLLLLLYSDSNKITAPCTLLIKDCRATERGVMWSFFFLKREPVWVLFSAPLTAVCLPAPNLCWSHACSGHWCTVQF